MVRLPASKLREELAETLDRLASGGERIILERQGKDVAVLISMDDLALLERIEDSLDDAEAERALSEANAAGETPVDWEKVKRDLGL